MSSNVETTRPGQSRRVAAWIYAVINPILESLDRELIFLERGNLSWRGTRNKCEYIQTIREYVDSRQWPNYRDFLIENGKFAASFDLHDSLLAKTGTAAKNIYDTLLSDEQFSQATEGLLRRYEEHRTTAGPHLPSYIHARKELLKVAAENLINNLQSLPDHYTYSAIWNFAGKEMFSFRNLDVFSPLYQAESELNKASSRLKVDLEERRLDLSRNYDVPAAPVPGVFDL